MSLCMRARKQTIIVDFFYIALITSIVFLSLSTAIIYIITTFHKLYTTIYRELSNA